MRIKKKRARRTLVLNHLKDFPTHDTLDVANYLKLRLGVVHRILVWLEKKNKIRRDYSNIPFKYVILGVI